MYYIIAAVMKMDEKAFSLRLAELRVRKNISAREMSLAIGQNPSYINRIENGHAYPSMQCFFYICDFLGVSPREFFDYEDQDPFLRLSICRALCNLDAKQLAIVQAVVDGLAEAKR